MIRLAKILAGTGVISFPRSTRPVVVESWHSEVVHVPRSAGFQGFGGGHQGFRQGAGRHFLPFTRIHHVLPRYTCSTLH